MDGSNLFYHCLCLIWQLSSNYALLGTIDEKINERNWGTKNIITNLTSIVWIFHLLTSSPTPITVKLSSALSVVAAHRWLGPLFANRWRMVMFVQGLVEAAAIQLVSKDKKIAFDRKFIAYFAIRSALWKWLSDREGSLEEYSSHMLVGLMALMILFASTKKPIAKCVSMGLYGWALALLGGSRTMYFWSCGMMATLCQGVAHNLAGEAGTLQVLEGSKMDTVAYELSHTVYFPNLLFQACFAHLGWL